MYIYICICLFTLTFTTSLISLYTRIVIVLASVFVRTVHTVSRSGHDGVVLVANREALRRLTRAGLETRPDQPWLWLESGPGVVTANPPGVSPPETIERQRRAEPVAFKVSPPQQLYDQFT